MKFKDDDKVKIKSLDKQIKDMGEQTKRGLMSGVRCNGASNHSNVVREIDDFYATPPVATKVLIKYLDDNYPMAKLDTFWEPACGKGHISDIFIDAGYKVISTDLIDRGYGCCGNEYNFLNDENTSTNCHIVTNPPYKYAQQFVEKAMDVMENGTLCCMLLKLTFLEGTKRYEMFKKYPPKHIIVFANRINCAHSGDFEKTPEYGGSIAYAWYIWEKGYSDSPKIEWAKA